MNTIRIALLSLALSSTTAFAGECTPPQAPAALDGASATMEQMMASQKAVKSYQAANLDYMGCLDPMIAAATEAAEADSATDDVKNALKQLEEQYNEAVSSEEDVAGQFNTAIRAYKAANPG